MLNVVEGFAEGLVGNLGVYLVLYSSALTLTHACLFFFFLSPRRRKSKVRRSKSRYKILEADEQDSLELQPPRTGETHPHKCTVTNIAGSGSAV